MGTEYDNILLGLGEGAFFANSGAVPQALPVAELTDISVESASTTKSLKSGKKLYATETAEVERKVTMKAKMKRRVVRRVVASTYKGLY